MLRALTVFDLVPRREDAWADRVTPRRCEPSLGIAASSSMTCAFAMVPVGSSSSEGRRSAVARCDCWRETLIDRLHSRGAHSAPLSPLRSRSLRHLRQRVARERARAGALAGRALSGRQQGTVPARAARRRQDAPRGRGAAPADRGEGRARRLLRHARSAARDPQHLQPDPARAPPRATCSVR